MKMIFTRVAVTFLLLTTSAVAQQRADMCEADPACKYTCTEGRGCACLCTNPGRRFYEPAPHPERHRRYNYCPPPDIACRNDPYDPCCPAR